MWRALGRLFPHRSEREGKCEEKTGEWVLAIAVLSVLERLGHSVSNSDTTANLRFRRPPPGMDFFLRDRRAMCDGGGPLGGVIEVYLRPPGFALSVNVLSEECRF